MPINRERAKQLAQVAHAKTGSRDLLDLLNALIEGELSVDDVTALLDVENPTGSDLLFREGGVRKKMDWGQFLATIIEEIGNLSPGSGTGVGTYFIDAAGGDDSKDGRSAATAWQTVPSVNARVFLPGDIVSFKRGQTHNGGIVWRSSGTAAARVLVNAYGTGTKPVIASGAVAGFTALNAEYFTIDGLEFLGGVVEADLTRTPNAVDGIRIENDQAGDVKLVGVKILNNTVHEYGLSGINVIGTNGASGTTGLLLDNNEVYACTHNTSGGLHSSGLQVCSDDGFGASANGYSHLSVTIRGNKTHDNVGSAGDTSWNGSGLYVAQTNGALITGHVAYVNGALNNLNSVGAGAFGIAVKDSTAVLVQDSESYNNRVAAGISYGGGIGILGGCTACVVERCYTHGNQGSGIVLHATAEADMFAWDGNTVRFCILVDDHSRAYDRGGSLAVIADANMINVKVHNNTIYQRGGSPRNCLMLATSTGILITDFEGYIANNLIQSTSTAALLQGDNGNSAFMRLRGNNYYSSGTFFIEWNGTDYTTYAAWQTATSGAAQEKIAGVNVGLHVDPLLSNPTTAPVVNAVNSLLTGYKLQSLSPMIDAGLDLLAAFSFSPGTRDFFNSVITAPFNIGASEDVFNQNLAISGSPTTTGTLNENYGGFAATATGGVPPYTYSKIGTWPAGPALNTSTGVVSTAPITELGTFSNLYIRVTDTALATANLGPFTITVTDTAVVVDPLAPNIPEGTDNETIIWSVSTALSNPTYSIIASGVGMALDGPNVIMNDKALFFAQAQPHITVRATSGASHEDFTTNFNIVPGYYDVGKFGHNLGMHWDMGDQGSYIADEGDTFFEVMKDRSSWGRDLQNPWYPERRQRIGSPSTLKSSVKGFRSIRYRDSALYGVTNMTNSVWNGFRYVSITAANAITLVAANTPNDQDKTVFSGLPSLIGRNLMVVISATATACTVRIDGIQVQQKTVAQGYFPPRDPCIVGFTCNLTGIGVMLSPNLFGQHPSWEDGAPGGDIIEFFQLFNVQAGA